MRLPAAVYPFFLPLVLPLVLLLLLALGAPSEADAQGAQPSRSVSVEAGERGLQYLFTPNTLTVPTGQVTVTYKNSGLRKHNFSVEALNLMIPDVDMGATTQATFNFPTPGTYEFICDLPNHAQRGMRGTITVVAAPQEQAQAGAQAQAQATAAQAQAQPTAAGGTTPQATSAAATAPAATRPAATAPVGSAASTPGSAAVSGGAAQGAARNLPLFISLAIHVPSAVTWLGIALYDVIVIAAPFLSPVQRGGLLQRPRWVVVALIPVILATGVYQTINNPFSTLTDFASLETLRSTTTYGLALFLKHAFVLASWALTLALSFWVAPRLMAAGDGSSVAAAASEPPAARLPALVAWGNALACAALVLCVTVMIFQLH